MDQLPYRPNVCMLVVNSDNKYFLGERTGSDGVWQFPQGGVDDRQSDEDAVVRELHEELGADSTTFSIIARLEATREYDFDVVPEYAKGRWRGQRQSFWLVRFLGGDEDIKLDRYHPEFSSFKWCTEAEVRELAEPKRLVGYIAPMEEAQKHLTR